MKTSSSPMTRSKSELKTPSPTIKREKSSSPNNRQIPAALYAEDGTIFYPCKHCCRAFARKVDLKRHTTSCTNTICFQTPSPKALPLTSMENTMNDNTKVSSPPEVNNNKGDDNYSEIAQTEKAKETIFCFPVPHDSIFALDLISKAKVIQHLNIALQKSPFTILLMNNGDIVMKTETIKGLPDLEILAKLVENDNSRAQICVKCKNGIDKPPEFQHLLEVVFAEDPEIQSIVESFGNGIKTELGKAIDGLEDAQMDDTLDGEDVQMSEDDIEGAIVLEDIDIHICKQCGAVYHTLEELVNHDRYDHRKARRKYGPKEIEKFDEIFRRNNDKICPICLKKLKNFSCWQRHVQSHCEIGMFECTVCKRRFTRDDHRKTHEKRHVVSYEKFGEDDDL